MCMGMGIPVGFLWVWVWVWVRGLNEYIQYVSVTEHNKFMLLPHPEEDSYLPCVQWPTP